MSDLRFTKDHEWVRLEGDVATVGITDHAQQALGDLVFVELPEPGRQVTPGEPIAVVESVKAASDVYAPLAGRIVEVNQAIIDNPSLVNAEPQDGGWFFRMDLSDAGAVATLMDETAYAGFLETLA